MTDKLGWGILGTGGIARAFAKAVNESSAGKLIGVGSRTQDTADNFGEEYGIPHRYRCYDALLEDGEVAAVYISLPNHLHAEWTIKGAQAGKHILCEKPLTVNQAQAMAVIAAVRYHEVFMMEAFMYRCHPQTARLQELIRDGVIGEVRLLQANFSYNLGPKYDNIRLQNEAAGGGIMDVGCYTASIARLIAGAALGQEVAEPIEVKGCAHLGAVSRVDEQATAALKFPGGIVANLATGCQVGVDSTLRIWGSAGSIVVPNPWFPGKGENKILVNRSGAEQPEEIVVRADYGLYSIEADTVARHLNSKQAPSPCMTWADTLGNMQTLDLWRKSVGLQFDEEKFEAAIPTVSHRPLRHRSDHRMQYAAVPGLDKPVSRLVLGSMVFNQEVMPFTCAMLDYFVECGGNCIDTAYVYASERALGRWFHLRDNRGEILLIDKGAHTPDCTVEGIGRHLEESLDRLQTDYIDLWFIHRDNPEVPVGEFIECLNEHQRAGRIRAFGASNWWPSRIEAANEYARQKGLAGFVASSPNFSLAVMVDAIWAGSIAATDPASRSWYERTQLPLFAWSSQAQGFFTGRFGPEDQSNPEMVRCWYSQDNFQRLNRAQELAREKGVTANQVALAYVLCQPFPTFALVGPRTIEEMRTTALGLQVELAPDELRHLNLED
ncbi:MAG: aldo/keto reductase [Armatimonadetes bacterium]|nr:aldo/keto reductase [Armatimonadota bacterium]